ncbi:MAG TPA: glycosyltransferase family 2 protein [Alphaproteobacteria bacterium]
MAISVIVLTFNSEATVGATLASARAVTDDLHVVDSFSTDRTIEIARAAGARVVQRAFENYSAQRNWAIDNLPLRHGWQLHLDADERLSDELAALIKSLDPAGLSGDIAGYYIPRLVHFHGRPLRHGGMYPMYQMRLFRSGAARCEMRKYDQHFICSGRTGKLDAPMIDDIRLPLGEWTARHNRWADAEVEELLNPGGNVIQPGSGDPIAEKRAQKSFYYRQPLFLRAFLFFLYRYVWKRGFLDGKEGMIFYVLQTFWFRFLVDAKLYERQKEMRRA